MIFNPISIKPIESYQIGDSAVVKHKITGEDVETFSKMTGDYNPLHLDEEFAGKTSYRKPVVYGMLSASFISTLIGMILPGPGALWTSQTLEFLQQVYIGDELTVYGEIRQVSTATRTLVIKIEVTNQRGNPVITGEAAVKILEMMERDREEMDGEKILLITGASRGIGAATARKAASEGNIAIVNYHDSEADARKLCDEIIESGGIAYPYKADISNADEVKKMISRITAEVGDITAFVHCAAPNNEIRSFEQLEWAHIQKQFDIQVKGAFNCLSILLPQMTEKEIKGKIVIIGSIASDGAPPLNQTDYVLTKAALSAFAKSLANEYGPKGISVNIVSPGMTETDRIINLPEKAKLLTRMQTPARALNHVEDIADAVMFLLNYKSCALTGETIRVCGGVSMI